MQVEPGNRKRSARYRFNLPESAPATTAADVEPPKPRTLPRATNATKSPVPRTPTTYELVERKKALQDLINALPHADFRDADDRKQCTQLKKELANVNSQLAGVAQ